MIRVDIETIIMASGPLPSTIVLRERSDDPARGPLRALSIQTGSYEAAAISRGIDNPGGRPITHDLFTSTLNELGVKLERVEIDRVDAPVFYSKIVLTSDVSDEAGGNGSDGHDGTESQPEIHEVSIDARPSDALALAVRANAPIYVEDDVMNRAGTISWQRSEDSDQEEIEQFDRFVQTLSPDDF